MHACGKVAGHCDSAAHAWRSHNSPLLLIPCFLPLLALVAFF